VAQSSPSSGPKRTRKAGGSAAPTTAGAPSGPAPTLRVLETRVLRGPNYWAREPVIRLLVDLGVLEDYPSNLIPAFTDMLVGLMPTLEDHADLVLLGGVQAELAGHALDRDLPAVAVRHERRPDDVVHGHER